MFWQGGCRCSTINAVSAHPAFIVAVVCLCVALSELLVAHTIARHAGTALVVILVGALASNLGVIPASVAAGESVAVYDGVFGYIAPLGIFWLLLRVNLRDVMQAGLPLLGLFLLGSLGTVLGVLVGALVVGPDAFGPLSAAMTGMFAATYTGGSANFNALALHYKMAQQGALYAGAMAVDAGLTALWMVVTIAVPKFMPRAKSKAVAKPAPGPSGDNPPQQEVEHVGPAQLAVLGALGFAALWLAQVVAAQVQWPTMVILTAFALILAQVPAVARLKGAAMLGMFAVYLFLGTIGALCDVAALASLGHVGLMIAVFATICIVVHGVLTFGVAAVLRLDPDLAAVASQANIGGGTTALALARSLKRPDLVLPAVLVGSVGTALGTFIGFFVAEHLVS